jgi:CRP/FNR family transcriptional regulator, cyclic AMP receptor protein
MAGEDPLYDRFGREFPKGHVLFKEGETGKEMYVIQSGKVRIGMTVRGVEKTLVVLGAGEFFGEMAILNNKPRSASATVEEDGTKVLVIEPKKLAGRLQESDDQIENLLLRDHNSRVVHFLSHTSSRMGKQTPDGVAIDITVKELAGKVGLDLEPVNDVLNKLLRAKLLKITETGFVIQDVSKLREFLEFLEMKEKFGDI